MEAGECNDPFKDFMISSHDLLKDLKRSQCPKCKASRMYFCYTCYEYVEGVNENLLPKVKLPIAVDIIKHPKELDGKSTAVHAALLAPEDVHIYTYPIFPDYASEKEDVVLLFPGPNANGIEHFCKKVSSLKRPCTNNEGNGGSPKRQRLDELSDANSDEEKSNDEEVNDNNSSSSSRGEDVGTNRQVTFKKVVMVDSTWNQVHAITTDERLAGIPCVELTQQSTMYWRRQHNSPDTFLSTIEALHAFVKQYHEIVIGKYNKQYDDLLYFFKFFYQMVHRNKASRSKPK